MCNYSVGVQVYNYYDKIICDDYPHSLYDYWNIGFGRIYRSKLQIKSVLVSSCLEHLINQLNKYGYFVGAVKENACVKSKFPCIQFYKDTITWRSIDECKKMLEKNMIEKYEVHVCDGVETWYQLYNRELKHRLNGPAVIKKNGHKEWWVNGLLHREDGPAVEYKDGTYAYYLHGKQYPSKEEFEKALNKSTSCAGKVVEIDGKKYKLTEV